MMQLQLGCGTREYLPAPRRVNRICLTLQLNGSKIVVSGPQTIGYIERTVNSTSHSQMDLEREQYNGTSRETNYS